jgi:hypothetical protein
MLNGVRERLTYANVIATCALFVALGGGAYALEGRNTVDAGDLKKNAVKPPEIAKNAVKKAETAKNSVGTGEVVDASLLEKDFAPGQLPAGPQGEQGEPGADATNLFGYIEEGGVAGDATLQYGTGVTSVSEPPGTDGEYTVGFNRSLANCVVHATAGTGEPRSPSITRNTSIPLIRIDEGGANELTLQFRRSDNDNDFGVQIDTSFVISAFC